MQIFGSDGFRCKFGTKFLTDRAITKFAQSLVEYYFSEGFENPILIGRDTRKSGEKIEEIVSNILTNEGIDVTLAGVIPTPGLSKILENGEYSFGCMITASHNPHEDNGIKLLKSDGFKIDIKCQDKIEYFMHTEQSKLTKSSTRCVKAIKTKPSLSKYIHALRGKIKAKNPRKKIFIDCSNGANSSVSEYFLDMKNIHFFSNDPNGNNINLNCGALEPIKLSEHVKKMQGDYGVAFDGDGDRAIFASCKYGPIQTEKIALLFFQMFRKKSPKSKIVVTTEISNLSFEHNINRLDGQLIITPVGDRYVIDAVNKHNAIFGFEPSGHFYFPTNSNSMDGISTLLNFINLLNWSSDFEKQINELPFYERITKNIDISENLQVDENKISNEIQKLLSAGQEKFVIRKSMWDPVLRIYYDFAHENNFDKLQNQLIKLIYKV